MHFGACAARPQARYLGQQHRSLDLVENTVFDFGVLDTQHLVQVLRVDFPKNQKKTTACFNT